jgi:hypothetical protein
MLCQLLGAFITAEPPAFLPLLLVAAGAAVAFAFADAASTATGTLTAWGVRANDDGITGSARCCDTGGTLLSPVVAATNRRSCDSVISLQCASWVRSIEFRLTIEHQGRLTR